MCGCLSFAPDCRVGNTGTATGTFDDHPFIQQLNHFDSTGAVLKKKKRLQSVYDINYTDNVMLYILDGL